MEKNLNEILKCSMELTSNVLKLEEKLNLILEYTMLAAKTVLTLDDASLLTGLSKSHLYQLTHRKEIPHYKRSKLIYFDKVEIESWLKSNRISTNDELEQVASDYLIKTRGI